MKLRTLTWVATAATAITLTSGAAPASAAGVLSAAGPLSDLSAETHATDGASARLYAVEPGNGSTYFFFVVTGLDPAAAGTTYGAHVHTGSCVPGNGAAAGPHYNTGAGGAPSTDNEVWLDFTVRPGGVAVSRTTVPFEIAPGDAHSVVIHAQPTQHGTGNAGARIACLPVDF
jgi:Cu/Zn superoxide dismutase